MPQLQARLCVPQSCCASHLLPFPHPCCSTVLLFGACCWSWLFLLLHLLLLCLLFPCARILSSLSYRETERSYIYMLGCWVLWKRGHVIQIHSFLVWDQAVNIGCPPRHGNCPATVMALLGTEFLDGDPSRNISGERILEGQIWCFILTCGHLEFCLHKLIWDYLKIKLPVCCLHFPVAFFFFLFFMDIAWACLEW